MRLSAAWNAIPVAVEVAANHEPGTAMFQITFENLHLHKISGKDGRTEFLLVVPYQRLGIVKMGHFQLLRKSYWLTSQLSCQLMTTLSSHLLVKWGQINTRG